MFILITDFATRNCHELSNKKDADMVARAKSILEEREREAKSSVEKENPKESFTEKSVESKESLVEKPKAKPAETKKSLIEKQEKQEKLFEKTHRIIQVSVNNLQCLMSLVLCLTSLSF